LTFVIISTSFKIKKNKKSNRMTIIDSNWLLLKALKINLNIV